VLPTCKFDYFGHALFILLISKGNTEMAITQNEFEAILTDTSKRIDSDINWKNDEDHSPAVEFRVPVHCTNGYPLFVNGRYNGLARTLSFHLIHSGTGRIYGLDLGADHHNPQCNHVGEKHKHKWSDACADKEAYVPPDITAQIGNPVLVWQQFCTEAKIIHNGSLDNPPPAQEELFL
jgi:hypothetical protein